MLIDYGSEIDYLSKDFDKKLLKRLKIDSLVKLGKKLTDLDSETVEKSFIELRNIIRNIADDIPKQKGLYRKEFELLKKRVIEEFGYYPRGSFVEKYTGLGLVFGVAIGTGLTSASPVFVGAGIAIGMAIGSSLGSKKEKREEEAGNLY